MLQGLFHQAGCRPPIVLDQGTGGQHRQRLSHVVAGVLSGALQAEAGPRPISLLEGVLAQEQVQARARGQDRFRQGGEPSAHRGDVPLIEQCLADLLHRFSGGAPVLSGQVMRDRMGRYGLCSRRPAM